ncbi:Zwei Ig domain protein zig-8-like 13 [Homarus americanus]|uniref:Zwei Ig domain protein zig-8-like 13 n=1 Tax=Homarus americanus TaxID=6706 RepID=A0A8J5KFR3_HOMAM|nr:Zwei Ig domain protein zig-8-like 13 [Homarus americanus]
MTVSWYRKRGDEIQLITFGFQTYHNDDRFSLSFAVPSDWRLQVRSVQARDEGTLPVSGLHSSPYHQDLTPAQAAIQILDERSVELKEKFYRTGSTIELQCRVSRVPSASALQLIWYHDDNKLNYDAPRGGVSVKTELRGTVGHSWLLVGNAMKEDSGVYSCNVTNIATASVVIHVVPEEYPAAIQQGRCLGASTCLLLLAALTHACCCCHPHR